MVATDTVYSWEPCNSDSWHFNGMEINHIMVTVSTAVIIVMITSSTLFSTRLALWNQPWREAQASSRFGFTVLQGHAQPSCPGQLPHTNREAFQVKGNVSFCATCAWNSAHFVCLSGDWGGLDISGILGLFMNICVNNCNLNVCANFEGCLWKEVIPRHHNFHVWMDVPPFLPHHTPVI